MSPWSRRTIRVEIFAGDRLVHETVVDSKGLKVIREHSDPKYRIEISPAPDWEEVGRWDQLRKRLEK